MVRSSFSGCDSEGLGLGGCGEEWLGLGFGEIGSGEGFGGGEIFQGIPSGVVEDLKGGLGSAQPGGLAGTVGKMCGGVCDWCGRRGFLWICGCEDLFQPLEEGGGLSAGDLEEECLGMFAGAEAIDAEIRIGAGILGGGDVADLGAVGHPAGRMEFEV